MELTECLKDKHVIDFQCSTTKEDEIILQEFTDRSNYLVVLGGGCLGEGTSDSVSVVNYGTTLYLELLQVKNGVITKRTQLSYLWLIELLYWFRVTFLAKIFGNFNHVSKKPKHVN